VTKALEYVHNYTKQLQFLQGEFQGLRGLCLVEVHCGFIREWTG